MKILLYLGGAVFLLPATATFAADVDYQHPNITIVANNEPLDSVLNSVSREMHIFVTTPNGFNPVVNCDIQSQPLEQAFKTLMRGMSYSLEWKSDGQQLIGLTILSGSDVPTTAVDVGSTSAVTPVSQFSGMSGTAHSAPSVGQQVELDGNRLLPAAHSDARPVEQRDREDGLNSEVETQEVESQETVVRKLGELEIELELRRQEEVIAREAAIEEEEARNQAEVMEYFETYGINPNQ